MPFQIHALPAADFAPLFDLSDSALSRRHACRQTVTAHPGSPCRVSLADAKVGETVLLLNYSHQTAASPYRASHAIFVRQGVPTARPEPGEVPKVLRSRLISLRAFDMHGMMIDADVVDGDVLADRIERCFDTAAVAEIHLHNAKPACFTARATRA